MENHVALEDDDETSRPSSVASNEPIEHVIFEIVHNDLQENPDDGYDSVSEASEPEEIYVDKRYLLPDLPPPQAVPFVQIEGEAEANVNYNRRPRRMEDRYHPYSRTLSRGYHNQGPDHALR